MTAKFIGQNFSSILTTSGNNLTGTTARAILPGEQVVCFAGSRNGSAGQVASISVGSLSLLKDEASNVVTDNEGVEIWSAPATALIALGASWTITWANTGANPRSGISFSISGVVPTSYIRGTPQLADGSSNPSVASDANPLNGDIAVAATVIGASGGCTAGTGYTLVSQQMEASQGSTHAVEYQQLGAQGSTTAGFTLSALNTAIIVVYVADSVALTDSISYTRFPKPIVHAHFN